MEKNLETMENAANRSIEGDGVFCPTGLTGGDAVKIKKYRESRKTLSGDLLMRGVQSAVGTNEVNAAMGVICATPTAGASGTIPGILFRVGRRIPRELRETGLGGVAATPTGVAVAIKNKILGKD